MIRCMAIDDEDLALELMVDYIGKVSYLQLAATADNAIDAATIIEEQDINLVFADIQMPGLTGLQLIKSLTVKPMFILATAYDQYALEGYELDVVDYLVKPVPFDRFLKACNKAKDLFQLRNKEDRQARDADPDHIFIYVDYTHVKVNFADIVWVEGFKDYIRIHLKSTSKPIVARISMKSMEEQLPPARFIRIQKSYIVAKDSITAIRKNSVFIGAQELPVGENYKDTITHLLGSNRGNG